MQRRRRRRRAGTEGVKHAATTEINNGTRSKYFPTEKEGHLRRKTKKGEKERKTGLQRAEVSAGRLSVNVGVWPRIPGEQSPGE